MSLRSLLGILCTVTSRPWSGPSELGVRPRSEGRLPRARLAPCPSAVLIVVWAPPLVVASGVGLRFWAPTPLWLDETLSVNIARLPLTQIPRALAHDGAPPLYYVLLHVWMARVRAERRRGAGPVGR